MKQSTKSKKQLKKSDSRTSVKSYISVKSSKGDVDEVQDSEDFIKKPIPTMPDRVSTMQSFAASFRFDEPDLTTVVRENEDLK